MENTVRTLFDSYARAFNSGDASAVTAHYCLPFTGFALDTRQDYTTMEEATGAVQFIQACYVRQGLTALTLGEVSVNQLSAVFATALVDFEMSTPDGTTRIPFTNPYGVRQTAEGPKLQFAVADNEIMTLLTTYPDFFTPG